MHFRHFFISSLLVGAAMFFTDNAYAENNNQSEKRQFEKASVHAATPGKTEQKAVHSNIAKKVENSAQLKKTVEIPDPAIANQGKGKEKSAKEIPMRMSSEKSAMASQNIPAHAKGDARSKVKKDKKVARAVKAEKNSKLVKNKLKPKKAKNDNEVDSLHNTDIEIKSKTHSGEIFSTRETKATVSNKESLYEPTVPVVVKQGKPPAHEEELPNVSKAMNPTQRGNSSGGQSHDRLSNGLSTISFLEKWFVWNTHFEMNLDQPYLSRYARMNNQWVNAPPSQPPQIAPLLKTVSRC